MTSIVSPCRFSSKMTSSTAFVSATPSAAVGSSMRMSFDPQAPARAIATTCRCPPDSNSTGSAIGGTLPMNRLSISLVLESMLRLSRM